MPLSPQKILALQKMLFTQKQIELKNQTERKRKDELNNLPYLKQEEDPFFMVSPASLISDDDLIFIRTLPFKIEEIQKKEGPKGEKGDAIIGPPGRDGEDGKSIIGPKGDRGLPGKDGQDAGPQDVLPIVEKEIGKHDEQFNHTLIHDPKVLGDLEIDMSTIQDGDILQVRMKDKKIIGAKLPKEQKFIGSSGISSNLRNILVTASRELDAMGRYIIDATAGNITISLPSAAGREEYTYELIRIDPTNNTVTILPNGAETMSGMTNYIMQQWTDITLFAYQGNYLIHSAG